MGGSRWEVVVAGQQLLGQQGGLGGAACMYNTPKYLLLEILDKGK